MFEFLNSILQGSPVVQGGLTLMIAGWLGYQLRALPSRLTGRIRSWLTREVEIREEHPHYDAWLEMLSARAIRPGGPRTLQIRHKYADHNTRNVESRLAAGADSFWAHIFGRWCHVSIYREGGTGGSKEIISPLMISVEVFLGSRRFVERLCREAARVADVGQRVQLVEVFEQYGDTSTIAIPKRHARTLCLPAGFFDSVELRLREFIESREQYEAAGIPWRYGVLLAGAPGTGKTSLAHALASHLCMRLVVIPLADVDSDRELIRAFRSVTDRAIVLIEDVDCAFKQRDAEAATGISFSGLLNCIDGLVSPHNGRILIMTTNHPEQLDPALVRPGRVDLNLTAPDLDRQAALDYVDRVFPHVPTRHEIVEEVMAGTSATPALLINRITREKWRRSVLHRPRSTEPAPDATTVPESR